MKDIKRFSEFLNEDFARFIKDDEIPANKKLMVNKLEKIMKEFRKRDIMQSEEGITVIYETNYGEGIFLSIKNLNSIGVHDVWLSSHDDNITVEILL